MKVQGGYTGREGDGTKPPLPTTGSGVTGPEANTNLALMKQETMGAHPNVPLSGTGIRYDKVRVPWWRRLWRWLRPETSR